MFVTQGVRTAEFQNGLYRQGRDLPGPIVTNKDGYLHKSDHQVHPDGLGYAVDCAFLGDHPFAATHDWSAYGALVRAGGLVWGGDWLHLVDRPHAELPSNTVGLHATTEAIHA